MNALHLPTPLYPPEARNTVPAGMITVMVEVNEMGNVTSARACAGHHLLRPSAEDAARQTKIKQTKLGGVSVKVRGALNYRFDPNTAYTASVTLSCEPSMRIIKILNGYAVNLVKPERPADATGRTSTAVSILVTVDETGKVEKAIAVSGDHRFRQNAVNAAKESTFRRFVRCGQPVKLSSVLVYNFKPPN